jgi:hypothetical protein
MLQDAGHAVADDLAADPDVRRGTLMRRDPFVDPRPLAPVQNSQIRRAPGSSGLYEVLDLILDKGIVVDAFVRVSLVGIELLTVDLRVVIASVDTYLRYAEGVERLQINERSKAARMTDIAGGGMKQNAVKQGAKSLGKAMKGKNDDDDEGSSDSDSGGDDDEEGVGERLTHGVRHVLTKGVGRIMERLSGEERDESEDDPDGQRSKRSAHRESGGGGGKEGGGREPGQRRHNGAHGKGSHGKAGSRR